MRKILFIDRDGCICREPEDEQVDALEKLALMDDVIPSLQSLSEGGYELVLVSNQDGLGTEAFPQENFDKPHQFLMKLLASQGICFQRQLICPHFPNEGCNCRKPALGLVMDYLKDPSWCRQSSAFIGDRPTDMMMAEKMGIQGFMVKQDSDDDEMGWPWIARCLLTRPRRSEVIRKTKETTISLKVDLDDNSLAKIQSGIPFLDHMLAQLVSHGGIGIDLSCQGDLEVDEHHTVEDIAICLGEAIRKALGDKRGIGRYGFLLPMDESSAQVSLDIGGRPYFIFDGQFKGQRVGDLSCQMVPHFFRSFSEGLRANLHMEVKGENDHHMVEALFKGLSRALRQACTKGKDSQLPSSKGAL